MKHSWPHPLVRPGGLCALAAALALAALPGPAAAQTKGIQISVVDGSANPLSALPIGESLFVGVSGLEPDRSYQVWLYDESSFAVSYYQLTSDGKGTIEPSALWYHSGVHGCSVRPAQAQAYATHPYAFTRFDEAETILGDRTFRLAVRDPEIDVELASRALPLVLAPNRVRAYFSDASGCLMNSFSAGGVEPAQDVFVTIENLPVSADSQTVQVFVVPNRYGWAEGDALADPRSSLQRSPITVPPGQTHLTALLWPAAQLLSGAWDLVVRINSRVHDAVLLASDIISYPLDTGTLLMLFYDSACPSGYEFDIAGRPITGYPYFEFSDVFRKNESMWGAVDPAFVPAGHPGGTYGAYYVITDGSAGGGLVDVSGGHEIAPVKAGCINVTVTNIWNSSQVGTYDVVVDFGAVPAASAGAWTADNTYNANYDFIDRSIGTGAWVVEDPAVAGPYTVQSWSYAPVQGNPNDPLWTDISAYYNIGGAAPLHGEVRYPAGTGPFPLVLVVHGNANPSVQSEQGYFYLLDLLASHGMIAVSVDENFLNGWTWGEMDARAIILLRHLQRWRTWNSTASHPFYQKVDLSQIGLAGHSRGGEAATVAWLFNTSLHNAGDPDHNFNFSVRSLFAIAPVDRQILADTYAGAPPVLRDVDYFIMHGSHDGDVYDFQGQDTYDRAHPVTLATTGLKSLLWVYGANHNYWNTVWALSPDGGVEPAGQLITAAQQQDIGKVYMSAFFQQTLLGRIAYKALLTGDATFPTLPASVTRVHQYHDPDRLFIDHYEEDDNLATNSLGGADANPGGLVTPYVDHAFWDEGNPYWLWQETDGLVAGWTNTTARYEMGLPNLVGTLICNYPYVALRVGQNYEPVPNRNTVGQSQDLSVQLQLAQPSATLAVSRYDTLPYPLVTGWFPGDGSTTKTILKTVRIPLRTFLLNQPALDLQDITRIDFLFNRRSTGLLSVDDVQITH